MSGKNGKPIKKLSAGGVQAAVWQNTRKRNDGEEYKEYSVSLDRSYKDKNGEWQSTSSLRESDIPKAALLLNQAYEFIVMKPGDDGEGDE